MFQGKNKKIKLNYSTYSQSGANENLLLIHDNGQSSKMFESEIRFYSSYFNTVTVDLTGHGRSGGSSGGSQNFWTDNAEKLAGLCEKLKIKRTAVIGTGGGAIVALNMALAEKKLVKKVIADSFTGLVPGDDYMESLLAYRDKIRNSEIRQKYQAMNGSRWEKILDEDTAMQQSFHAAGRDYFNGNIKEISCPVLMTGSTSNELIPDIESRLKQASEGMKKTHLHFFTNGYHPSILTKSDEFRSLSLNFLMD